MKRLTVGQLREVIKNIPDDVWVELSSDTGVDQGEGEVVVESAYHVKYKHPGGETVEYLAIYCNDRVEDNDEDL
jgi:hypothetical protein